MFVPYMLSDSLSYSQAFSIFPAARQEAAAHHGKQSGHTPRAEAPHLITWAFVVGGRCTKGEDSAGLLDRVQLREG